MLQSDILSETLSDFWTNSTSSQSPANETPRVHCISWRAVDDDKSDPGHFNTCRLDSSASPQPISVLHNHLILRGVHFVRYRFIIVIVQDDHPSTRWRFGDFRVAIQLPRLIYLFTYLPITLSEQFAGFCCDRPLYILLRSAPQSWGIIHSFIEYLWNTAEQTYLQIMTLKRPALAKCQSGGC